VIREELGRKIAANNAKAGAQTFDAERFLDSVMWDEKKCCIATYSCEGINNIPDYIWDEIEHVHELHMTNCNFPTFPDEIAGMNFLRSLSFTNSTTAGRVANLGNHAKLEHLDLSNNRFEGEVPLNKNNNKLRTIKLSGNLFSGSLEFIDVFSHLEVLDLGDNKDETKTQGPLFPLSLAGLANLQTLNLGNDLLKTLHLSKIHMNGPLSLHGLASLVDIKLIDAEINGQVSLVDMKNLVSLEMKEVKVTGPNFTLSGLDQLSTLVLQGVTMKGVLSLTGLNQLKELDLSRTNSSSFALDGLAQLTSLRFKASNISGDMSIRGLDMLEELDLRQAKPSSLTLERLDSLQKLNLDGVALTGPLKLVGLAQLKEALLNNALVRGNVTLDGLTRLASFQLVGAEIGALQLKGLDALKSLNLDRSIVSTSFSWDGLVSLESLDVSYAKIQVNFPSFDGLFRLKRITLAGTSCKGPLSLIGHSELTIVDISNKASLGGPLRLENLPLLAELKLDDSHISGEVVVIGMSKLNGLFFNGVSIGGQISIERLESIEIIDVSKIALATNFPLLKNLEKLHTLALGPNITGSLPKSWEGLGSLSELDLSNTDVSGELPSFAGLVGLQKLKLGRLKDKNENGLSLKPSSKSQLCKFHGELGNVVWKDLKRLEELDLSFQDFTGQIPKDIGSLKSLRVLNMHACFKKNSEPRPIPDELKSLRVLNMHACFEKISERRPIPAEFSNLRELTWLDMSNCNLTDDVPDQFMDCINLKHLNLQYNLYLSGNMPSLAHLEQYDIDHTDISSVTIKTRALKHWWDFAFVVIHVFFGYADLLSDFFAIAALSSQRRFELMGLNIAFLILNVLVIVYITRDQTLGIPNQLLSLFQVLDIVQAYETISQKRLTQNFVKSKKIDSIFRALPSMCLQLFGLLTLISLGTLTPENFFTLCLSICFSIFGSSMTMAQLAPLSGSKIFSSKSWLSCCLEPRFVVHFWYYVAEIIVRISIFVIIFISLYEIGFILLSFELFARVGLIWKKHDGIVSYKNWLIESFLWLGSDGFEGPGLVKEIPFVGLCTTSIHQFIALVIFNTLSTPILQTLRLTSAVRSVTTISCVCLAAKVLLAYVITGWEQEPIDVSAEQNASTSTSSKTAVDQNPPWSINRQSEEAPTQVSIDTP